MAEAKLRDIDGNLELVEGERVVKRWRKKNGKKKDSPQPIEGLTHPEEVKQVELHTAVLSDGTKVAVPRGTNLDHLPREVWPFGEEWSKRICAGVTEGKSLTAVCKQDGYPDIQTVHRWRRQYPTFEAEYQDAKKMQADWAFDKVLHLAEQLKDGEIDTKAARASAELYQWVAEVADRRTYQRTTRLEAEAPSTVINIFPGVPEQDPIEVPNWEPGKDTEWLEQAKKSPLFCQANTVKEEG